MNHGEMRKKPRTLTEVNNNLIEIKEELIKLEEKLSQAHYKYHTEKIRTPLEDIKMLESNLSKYKQLEAIALLQKENMEERKRISKKES